MPPATRGRGLALPTSTQRVPIVGRATNPGSAEDDSPITAVDPAAEQTSDGPAIEIEPADPVARRPFDPEAPPPAEASEPQGFDISEAFARSEKARHAHHSLLVRLHQNLAKRGWSELEEDRSVDLWGTSPNGARVIFEAKTIQQNELTQLRGALAQLLEYRTLLGTTSDRVAVVVNESVSNHRADVLEKLGIGVLFSTSDFDSLVAGNESGAALLAEGRGPSQSSRL